MTASLAVVELDPAGHRLGYVRAFVDESFRSGTAVRVVTTRAARHSAEWHEHMGDSEESAAIRLEQQPRSVWQYARLIRRSSPCVVLDSDAHLPALILSRLIGARFGMLVTRPLTPKLDPRWRSRSFGKTMLCLTLRALGVNIRLLVSPFTTEHPWEEIAIPACFRLATVVDPPLIPRSRRSRADARRVLDIDTNALVWVVAGVINDTKDLPTILCAMQRLAPDHHLVVAGKQDACAANEIAQYGSDLEATRRLTIVDRTMAAAELADVLRAADGVLVIKGSGLSSGIAIGAIANGTRVICTASNPQSGPGFVPFDGSIDGLARTLASLEPGVVITGGQAHHDGKSSLLSLLPFGGPAEGMPAVLR